MWKPDGSFTWSEAFNTFHKATEDVLTCLYGYTHDVDGRSIYTHTAEYYLVKSGIAQTYEEASLAISLTSTFLMANFLHEYPPMIADISGRTLELDWVFFTHKDQLELTYFQWPLTEAAPFKPYFQYQRSNGFTSTDLYQRFVFVNFETGLIRTSNGADIFLRHQIGLDGRSASEVLDIAEAVKGYLVYWPWALDADTMREFLSIIEISDDFTRALDRLFGKRNEVSRLSENPYAAKRGRPAAKTPEAISAIKACFPHGIDGASIKTVWKTIEAHSGTTFSDRTVRRAVSAFRQGGKISP